MQSRSLRTNLSKEIRLILNGAFHLTDVYASNIVFIHFIENEQLQFSIDLYFGYEGERHFVLRIDQRNKFNRRWWSRKTMRKYFIFVFLFNFDRSLVFQQSKFNRLAFVLKKKLKIDVHLCYEHSFQIPMSIWNLSIQQMKHYELIDRLTFSFVLLFKWDANNWNN